MTIFLSRTLRFALCPLLYDIESLAEFEDGFAHGDAEGFSFAAARYGAAVVTTKYHDGFVCEVWAEEAFAADEKTVGIYKCIHFYPY